MEDIGLKIGDFVFVENYGQGNLVGILEEYFEVHFKGSGKTLLVLKNLVLPTPSVEKRFKNLKKERENSSIVEDFIRDYETVRKVNILEPAFDEGDSVFHTRYGWGTVVESIKECPFTNDEYVVVEFDNKQWDLKFLNYRDIRCGELTLKKREDSTQGTSNQPSLEPTFAEICAGVQELLEYKNEQYKNSALEPLNVFAGKTKVGNRLDDKLARVKNGETLRKNDVVDVLGYLVLVCRENGWSDFSEFMD